MPNTTSGGDSGSGNYSWISSALELVNTGVGAASASATQCGKQCRTECKGCCGTFAFKQKKACKNECKKKCIASTNKVERPPSPVLTIVLVVVIILVIVGIIWWIKRK